MRGLAKSFVIRLTSISNELESVRASEQNLGAANTVFAASHSGRGDGKRGCGGGGGGTYRG